MQLNKYTYDASDTYYDKPEGSCACACLGAMYGEPMCPCSMARAGLPMSNIHVKEHEAAAERLKEYFQKHGELSTV